MICSAGDQYDVKGCRGPRGHTALCSGVQGTGVSGCGGKFEINRGQKGVGCHGWLSRLVRVGITAGIGTYNNYGTSSSMSGGSSIDTYGVLSNRETIMRWSAGSEVSKSATLYLLYSQVLRIVQVRIRSNVGWDTVLVSENCLFCY